MKSCPMQLVPSPRRGWALCLALVLLGGRCPADGELALHSSWDEPGLGGWTSQTDRVELENSSGHMQMQFAAQSFPRPDACVVSMPLPDGVAVTNLRFQFRAPHHAPSGLLAVLHSSRRDTSWRLALAPPEPGSWATFDVPVTFDHGWRSGPRSDRIAFFNDMLSADWIGLYVLRSGTRVAHVYEVDEVVVDGYAIGRIVELPDDTDGDGMPDTWEERHGLKRGDAGDADADSDGDGFTNVDEFRAGTRPNDPASLLGIRRLTATGDALVFECVGTPEVAQVLEWAESLQSEWHPVHTNMPAEGTSVLPVTLPAAERGFFRLRVHSR